MTIAEARRIQREFYENPNPTEDDAFLFTEAMDYIIQSTKDPHAMLSLGGYYYEKAFRYFKLAKDAGNMVGAYKLADMYKNGYYVEKDNDKYCEIIEELYPQIKNTTCLGDPLPEIATRLAHIRTEQGRIGEAVQLIRVTGGDYSQYEELLLRRDELEKDAEQILIGYTRIFGDITTEIFQLKIECIALKKSISYCVMLRNRGQSVDPEELQNFIAERMAVYQTELDEMIRQNELSKGSKKISAFQDREIKRIYRKIAKVLHPDISNVTEKYPSLADLFQRVMIAYNCNDYKELKELEVLVNCALEEVGEETFELIIPDIQEKMDELEEEIRMITTTEPYLYQELLNDSGRRQQKMKEFEEERDAYVDYKEKLELQLKEVQEK